MLQLTGELSSRWKEVTWALKDELGDEESHRQVLRVCFLRKVNAGMFWVG